MKRTNETNSNARKNAYNESRMTERDFLLQRVKKLSEGASYQELRLVYTYLRALKGLD